MYIKFWYYVNDEEEGFIYSGLSDNDDILFMDAGITIFDWEEITKEEYDEILNR